MKTTHPARRLGSPSAYWRFFRTAVGVNLASAMEYRANFLIQVFGMMLNNTAFIFFWHFLLERTGSIGGYGFRELMYLWAIGPASFGLATAVLGNCRSLARIIRDGDLDTFLLQPKDVLFNTLVSRSSVSAWGDLIYGFVVFAFLGPGLVAWGGFILFTLTGAIILTAILVMGDSLAFWAGGSEGISQFTLELMLSLSLYPETVFPIPMRWVLYTLVPTGFTAFLPLAYWQNPSWGLFLAMPAAALVFGAAAYGVFRAGLRHYGSGNKVGART